MSLLEVKNLKKVYTTRFSSQQVTALSNVSFSVEEGEYVAIMGESGSGKTTLLNILASLDTPTSGEVLLNGEDITKITFSLRDNIFLPLVLSKENYDVMETKLNHLAPQLGIESLLDKYPYEVSGGQKQRAAVARALITHPQIILADEPIGALDSKSKDDLLNIFDHVNKEGQTIVMVTHSTKAASFAKRVLFIRDGQVYHQIYKGDKTNEEMYQSISDTLTLLQTGGK